MKSIDWSIRPCTTDDYARLAEVDRTCYPEYPCAEQDYIDSDAHRQPKEIFGRWLVVKGDDVIGFCVHFQFLWTYSPRKWNLSIGVLPEYRRQGIGGTLYDMMLNELKSHDPHCFTCVTSETREDSVRFAQNRGFVEFEREGESHLDVAKFDSSKFNCLDQKLADDGIVIKTYNELADDPERDRKLYDLNNNVALDMPGSDSFAQLSLEEWLKESLHYPTICHDGYFVALDGDRYVGVSYTGTSRGSDILNQYLTGVLSEYRRKQIALALKLRTIEFAKAKGHPTIRTGNEVRNKPMLALNHRLGFVPQPDIIHFRREVRSKRDGD